VCVRVVPVTRWSDGERFNHKSAVAAHAGCTAVAAYAASLACSCASVSWTMATVGPMGARGGRLGRLGLVWIEEPSQGGRGIDRERGV